MCRWFGAIVSRMARVSPRRPSYPVAIIGAGATAPIVSYSTIAEDLASHGYVVVGFDSAYRTSLVVFPDGRVIPEAPQNNPSSRQKDLPTIGGRLTEAAVADTKFLLDQLEQLNRSNGSSFAGRLDLARVGVFGHSLGGSTALQFCQEDARCKAGIESTAAGRNRRSNGPSQAVHVRSERSQRRSESRDPPVAGKRSLDLRPVARERTGFRRHPRRQSRQLQRIRNGSKEPTRRDRGSCLQTHGISGRQQLAITTGYVHTFFDRYL